jgi:hypothetical protein
MLDSSDYGADAAHGKKDVLKVIDLWVGTYINYLQDLVRSQLDELQSFISDANEELKRKFIQETLPRTEKTDAMFGPIQESISLLKKFNINVKDITLKQL